MYPMHMQGYEVAKMRHEEQLRVSEQHRRAATARAEAQRVRRTAARRERSFAFSFARVF